MQHLEYIEFLLPYYAPAVFPPGHQLTSRDIQDRDMHPGMRTTSHIYETLLKTLVYGRDGPFQERVVSLLLSAGTNPTFVDSRTPHAPPKLICNNLNPTEKVHKMMMEAATTPERKTLLEKLRVLNTTAHVLTGEVINHGPHRGLRTACWAAVPRCLRERIQCSRPLPVVHLIDSTISHPWLTFKIEEKAIETENFLAVLRFATGRGETGNQGGTEGGAAWPLLPDELFNDVMGMLELRWNYIVLEAEKETGVGANVGGYDELRGRHQRESDEGLEAFNSIYFDDDGWTEEGEVGEIAREEEGEVESLAESLAVL